MMFYWDISCVNPAKNRHVFSNNPRRHHRTHREVDGEEHLDRGAPARQADALGEAPEALLAQFTSLYI